MMQECVCWAAGPPIFIGALAGRHPALQSLKALLHWLA